MSQPAIRVTILCAKFDEAEEFRQTLRHLQHPFEELSDHNIVYDHLDLTDSQGHRLSLDLHSGDQGGSVMTSEMATRILHQAQPHWLLMTGVCAGNPHKVKLGDLVIADRVYDLHSGKAMVGQTWPEMHAPEINPYLRDPIHRIVISIEEKQEWSQLVKVARPVSSRYKKEVLRTILYEHRTQLERSENPAPMELAPGDKYGLGLREIHSRILSLMACPLKECASLLQKMSEGTGALMTYCNRSSKYYVKGQQSQEIQDLIGRGEFPELDASEPKTHLGVMATDVSRVRADLSKEDWKEMEAKGDRNLLGLEMEGYGLYEAVHRYNSINYEDPRPKVQVLLIKGVSDVGDPEKGDEFHKYGKQISAAFVYKFLMKYGYPVADKKDGDRKTANTEEKKTI